MPTPVSTARQCLTEEAARALDDAVAVARRRSHGQTTSLHAVSALLALPSSILREACARARSSAYSPRLQFRALDLSVGVSLDRLPSTKALDEPPISNSLMAAIKRSQANQRRHPETFHLYQQLQQHNPSSISCVKVELKHFILSILDDPIVSRVFGDAGFRSCDIKLAIINPPTISRFSRSRCPPLFLCNLTDSESIRPSFNFPFASFSGAENGDENCRRIAEVLVKKTARNPLLIGVCADDALVTFTECVQRGKGGVFPAEIDGLSVISIEKEISEFVANGGSEETMGFKFKEVGEIVEHCAGSFVVVNYGDLKAFVDEKSDADAVKYAISRLSGLLDGHGGKMRLIGMARDHETYMKFSSRFPSIGKDWDLHLLPITSVKSSFAGLCSKSSLMGSFVPFGGFFPTPSEFENTLSSLNSTTSRCVMCNEKYEQDVSAILKGGSTTSVTDQQSAALSSWLHMTEGGSKRVDAVEAEDDGTVLNARIFGLQRKWNDICQRLHHSRPFQVNFSQSRTHVPEGFQFTTNRMEMSGKDTSRSSALQVTCEPENANLPKITKEVSQSQELFHPLCSLSLPPGQTSNSSVTSVTTDLGLGTLYSSSDQELRKSKCEGNEDRIHYFSGSVFAEFDRIGDNASNRIAQYSSCHGPQLGGQLDAKHFKHLRTVLAERVSWQDEAICTISQIISHYKSGHGGRCGSNSRGDIWLSFLGPDKVGKKKVATALAEIIFGGRQKLLCVDLSSEDGISHSNSIFDSQDLNSRDVNFRGKTVVDYIAEELRKNPHSIVLLENIDKAEILAQKSLSQAISTGKFPDTHGREISIKNMIFVTTLRNISVHKISLSEKEAPEFSEERILGARNMQMQISVECVAGNVTKNNGSNVLLLQREGILNSASQNKRKLIDSSEFTEQDKTFEIHTKATKLSRSSLDLNLPVEELDDDNDNENYDSDSGSENSRAWLEGFLDQVDERVIFRPIDFDALAKEILEEISLSFQKTVGSDVLLQIDSEVMVQVLAAAWLSDKKRAVHDWVKQVLCKTFVEAQQRYHLSVHSVVKLVSCKGLLVEEQAPGVCLPAKIILN